MKLIVHVVPYAKERGGIQTFAHTAREVLGNNYKFKLVDITLPNHAHHFIKKIVRPNYLKQETAGSCLVHFWHPLAAIGYKGSTNFIVTCHGKELLPVNLNYYQKLAVRSVLKRAKLIHTNSRFTKKLVLKLCPEVSSKIKVIYPGVKKRNIAPKNGGGLKIIGTLTRFNPRKNVPNVIKALEILHKENFKFKYVLVGKGIEEKKITDLLKEVKFDYQYNRDISDAKKWNDFYRNIDLFVFPPLSLRDDVEGFGIVCLEANSMGVPIVTSKVDGIKEAVGKNYSGIFVNPNRPKSIASGIKRILPKINKYRTEAKIWASKFSTKKMGLKMKKIYEDSLR